MVMEMASRAKGSFANKEWSPARRYVIHNTMKKLILFIMITLFGSIGWWLGAYIGVMTAYFVSVAGSLVGVYVGVKINQAYLD